MSTNRKTRKMEVVTQSPAPSHAIRRLVVTAFLLAAVLYVGVYLACRTDGFRSYAEEFLESHLGVPVHVKRIQSTLGLDLILTGVKTGDSLQKGAPGYSVQEALIRWSFLDRILSRGPMLSGLTLKDCSVSFALDESGGWKPAALSKLGAWLAEWGRLDIEGHPSLSASGEEIPEPERPVTTDFWDRVTLSIENGSVSWWDTEPRELASAVGIRFEITPVTLPNRKMVHYYLTLATARIGERETVRDLTFEMLKTSSNNIVLTCQGEWAETGEDGEGERGEE